MTAKLMIVEDEGIAALNLERKIKRFGHRSAGIAMNRDQAIALVKKSRPDLAILDINLGSSIDGLSVGSFLRDESVPVIYLTAFSDEETISSAAQTRPYGYLLKPIEDVALKTAIDNALGRSTIEAQLREQVTSLKSENSALENFAAMAAHDIRGPLSRVEMLLEIAEDDAQTYAPEALSSALKEIQRLQELMRDLLEHSRYRHANMGYEKVRIAEAVEKAFETVLSRSNKNAVCRKSQLPEITCNRLQMERLFTNLVENAIKYNPSEEPRVEVRCAETSDAWIFSVRDNGAGVPASWERKIFEPFTRAPGSNTEGTGLGLAICKSIVESHCGSIWVKSIKPHGAAFCFRLPKHRACARKGDYGARRP